MISRFTRMTTALTLAAIGGAGWAVVASTPAFAHTPEVASTCEGMTVTLENYDAGTTNTRPNALSVSIDGVVVDTPSFDAGFTQSYPFADKTVAHRYEVVIDAVGTEFDRTFSGDSTPCITTTTPPTEPPATTPPVTPPTEVPPATTPPVEPVDSPNPPASGGQQLAETGVDAAGIAGLAGGLALVGGLVTGFVRRHSNSRA